MQRYNKYMKPANYKDIYFKINMARATDTIVPIAADIKHFYTISSGVLHVSRS